MERGRGRLQCQGGLEEKGAMSVDDRLPLPDILRPTELHDFGDAFTRTRRTGRALVAVLARAGKLALGQFMRGARPEAGGDLLAAAAQRAR
jgi:hypothetical protein